MGIHLGAQEKPAAELCPVAKQHPRGVVVEIYPETPIELQPSVESVEPVPYTSFCSSANASFPDTDLLYVM